jgi:hypothetical protein
VTDSGTLHVAPARWLAAFAALALAAVGAAVGMRLAGYADGLLDLPQAARYVDALTGSPLAGVVGVAVLAAALMVGWRVPMASLYVVALLVPFQFVGGAIEARGGVTLPKVILNLALVWSIVVALLRRWGSLRAILGTALGKAYAVFLGFVLLGVAVGAFEGYPRFHWLRESNWYLFYALALAVMLIVTRWMDVARLIVVLGIGSLLAQLDAFRFFAVGQRTQRDDIAEFFRAPFSQTASWLLMLTLALGVFAWARGTRLRSAGWLVAAGILALGSFLSFGRAEWAATVVGVVITLGLVVRAGAVRATGYAVALLAAGVIGLGAAVTALTGRDLLATLDVARLFAGALVGGSDVSATGRMAENRSALVTWTEQPLGAGLGAPYIRVPVMDQDPENPYYIHDSYANMLVKLGPFGLAAFIALLVLTTRAAWHAVRASPPGSARQAVAVSLLAATVKAAGLSFVVPVLSTSDAVLHIAFVIGFVAVLQPGGAAADGGPRRVTP